jgi:hypothetical protein
MQQSGGSERKAAQFIMCQAVTLSGTIEQYAHLRNCVLLDNQSTADIFFNRNYLQYINEVPETLTLHTNGGVLTCNTKGIRSSMLSPEGNCKHHWDVECFGMWKVQRHLS